MNLKKRACFLQSRNQHLITYVLSFVLFCSGFGVQGQIMSITVPDDTGAETIAPAQDNITFRVTKSPGGLLLNYDVAYTITIGAGNGINGEDYTTLSGVVEVLGGGGITQADIIVDIIDDELVEGLEEVTITLDRPQGSGYFVDPLADTATATIVDNDIGTFTLVVSDPDAAEEDRDRGRFVIRLDKKNATGEVISVPYTLSPAVTNGADPDDYDVQVGAGQAGAFTFTGDQLARGLNIIPIDDLIPESDETVVLTLGNPEPNSSLFVLNPDAFEGSVIIVDNDCLAGVTPPILNGNPTAFCDVTGVDLNTFFTDDLPNSETELRWSLVQDPTTLDQLIDPAVAVSAPADTYFAVFWAPDEECASRSTTDGLVITINQTPNPGTTINGAACNNNTNEFGDRQVDLDDLISGEDKGEWVQTSGPSVGTIPNNNVVDFEGLPATAYEFTYTTDDAVAPCENASSVTTITVTDCDPCIAGNIPPTLNDTDRTFCGEIDKTLNDFVSETPPPNTELKWATSAADPIGSIVSDSQVANPAPGTYHGFFYDSLNDCASPTVALLLALNDIPDIPTAQDVVRCGPGEVILMVSATGNATFNWYLQETGGVIQGTGENFTTEVLQTTTYYLEATENGCASERVAVIATVQIQPFAGTPDTSPSSCNDPTFGTTTLDLDDLLTDADAGSWVFTSGPVDVPRNNENVVDFNTRPDGDYVYTFTTSGAQAPCVNESVSVSISVSSCDTDADGDGLLGGVEAALGTDPNNIDSDNDGINDDVEVGPDISNPLDEDEDGIIDALDSNLEDADNDGVVDQLDPANNNACIPDINNSLCDQPIDLEILKTVDKPNALFEEEVAFTITVRNLGPRLAKMIIIGDFLETGFEYVSNSTSLGDYNPDTAEWQLSDLAPDMSATLTLRAKVLEGGIYTNTAELLSSDPLDNNPANNSSQVTLGVDQPEGINLVIEKTAALGSGTQKLQKITGLINGVENELRVTYFIKVINKSESDPVSNIRVTDVFTNDSDIEFKIDEESIIQPSETIFNATSGVWTINKSLAKDEEIELSYTVVFNSVGVVVNTAVIGASSPRESEIDDEDSKSSVTVEITTRNPIEIGILYNQFSPNADGINDVIKVNRLQKNDQGVDELVNLSYNIEIFNRYGSLVYEAMNLTEEEAWDGTWEGKLAPEGTYFYALNVLIEGETDMRTSKGWIQLIR